MKKVILIVFDSVRPDHLSCYGYGRKTTPNIDLLSQEGSIFDATVAENLMPGTALSIYSILSGQTKIQPVGASKSECPTDYGKLTLPLIQQKPRPSLFGSNHLLLFSGLNWHLGWDYTFLTEYHPPMRLPAKTIVDWFLFVTGQTGYPLPRFSLLWLNDTHSPYVPDDSWSQFMADSMPTANIMGSIRLYDPDLLKENSGKPDVRKHCAYYDAAIHNLDNVIAPILQLKDKETLIIVCSDHGDWIGEYGHWFTHAANLLKDELKSAIDVLRPVFLVMSQPSMQKSATLLDIAPTIAHWLDIEPETFWEGKSLLRGM